MNPVAPVKAIESHAIEKGAIPDGPWTQKDEAGVLRKETAHASGKLHGPLKLFDETGAPMMMEHWRHGRREGAQQILVEGRLHSLAQFEHGLQHGATVLYHAGGTPAAHLTYSKGLLHGEAKYLDEAGNPVRTAHYIKGKLEGEARTFYPDGTLLSSEPYRNNLRHGEAKWFAPDGAVTKKVDYVDGKPAPQAAPPKEERAARPTAGFKALKGSAAVPIKAEPPKMFPPPLPKRK